MVEGALQEKTGCVAEAPTRTQEENGCNRLPAE
jgi:hypothetical protein